MNLINIFYIKQNVKTSIIDKLLFNQKDSLLSSGKYPNRSEVIRAILSRGIAEIVKDDLMGDLVSEIEDDSNTTNEDYFDNFLIKINYN